MFNSSKPNESHPLRRLAPAGGFPSLTDLCAVVRFIASDLSAALSEAVAYGTASCGEVVLTRSGSEAIYLALKICNERFNSNKLFLSAYSCPEIVSAARAAGFSITLCDVDERTLHPKVDVGEIPEHSVFLTSNLYGLEDDIERWIDSTKHREIIFINDRCQARVSVSGGPAETPHFAKIFSFGRGKTICGVGGGMLQLSEQGGLQESREVPYRLGILDFARWCIGALLERPQLYWFPSMLPFLKLGETTFRPYEPGRPLSRIQVLVALAKLRRMAADGEVAVKNAKLWHDHLEKTAVVEPFVERGYQFDSLQIPLRYPILVPVQVRTRILEGLEQIGLGASRSYPAPLNDICAGESEIVCGAIPGARAVAERIITLPVHRYVSKGDIERGASVIKAILEGA